ncbi:MAG: polysaccharide deacetylase family protein [Firmicutes bacterium]|nr:polysaccharide deacetylase family protein [Bacillota bacterium]
MKIIMTRPARKTLWMLFGTLLAVLLVPAAALLGIRLTGSIPAEAVAGAAAAVKDWGLGFGRDGEQPTGNASAAELLQYDAYYIGSKDQKTIYLTFDCGYENGNTPAILDALQKHHAPAAFFVVGHYLESAPELVKRMVAEGHTVGNHTYHHPNMASISDEAAFAKELSDVRAKFKEITGIEMAMVYRPPQGKYNLANLKMAQQLGYKTFFWSLAYVDWNQDSQPTREEALDKLTRRIHPGAVVLLHNTSKTNGEILDELLTKWEEMGYSFLPLSALAENTPSAPASH